MFTGIIEEVGTVSGICRVSHGIRLNIQGQTVLEDIHIGDSIAVNGICLTVTDFSPTSFTADVMAETLARTSLAFLRQGSLVNLERAMSLGSRFGGHIVTGHIDGVGTIKRLQRDGIAVLITIETDPKITRYIVEKGSIAIDGISLTIVSVAEKQFTVSVIPHTLDQTTLGKKKVNDVVNLENDCIGKYVEKLLQPSASRITADFLQRYGY
ncbi:MAG: riboflavin synthase [Peptococcaceae bacterium]|jgi:riboflavin synthase|nr:riboflavin synthase [Peptococcaceae bacterium]